MAKKKRTAKGDGHLSNMSFTFNEEVPNGTAGMDKNIQLIRSYGGHIAKGIGTTTHYVCGKNGLTASKMKELRNKSQKEIIFLRVDWVDNISQDPSKYIYEEGISDSSTHKVSEKTGSKLTRTTRGSKPDASPPVETSLIRIPKGYANMIGDAPLTQKQQEQIIIDVIFNAGLVDLPEKLEKLRQDMDEMSLYIYGAGCRNSRPLDESATGSKWAGPNLVPEYLPIKFGPPSCDQLLEELWTELQGGQGQNSKLLFLLIVNCLHEQEARKQLIAWLLWPKEINNDIGGKEHKALLELFHDVGLGCAPGWYTLRKASSLVVTKRLEEKKNATKQWQFHDWREYFKKMRESEDDFFTFLCALRTSSWRSLLNDIEPPRKLSTMIFAVFILENINREIKISTTMLIKDNGCEAVGKLLASLQTVLRPFSITYSTDMNDDKSVELEGTKWGVSINTGKGWKFSHSDGRRFITVTIKTDI